MTEKNADFSSIRNTIKNAERIVISAHTNPDGDAVGSCFGLGGALAAAGKDVKVLLEDYRASYDAVIPGSELLYRGEYSAIQADVFISLDCGDRERLGAAVSVFDRMNTICIDHHISNTGFADLNYVEEEASSTAEVVYKILDGLYPLNRASACAIYAGMLSDTGGFRHSSTGASTLEISSRILKEYDVNFTEIYNKLFMEHSFTEMKAMGLAIANASMELGGKAVVSTLTSEEIKACGATPKELGGIVEYLKNVEGAEVSAFIYEKGGGEIKVSLRSGSYVDVSKICVGLGGGGHVRAAGVSLYNVTVAEASKLILEILRREV